MKSRFLILLPAVALCLPAMAAADVTRTCLTAAETRTAIAENGLLDPLNVLKSTAGTTKAEPLRNRLCRWNQDFVYEISLLRHDGKVIRTFVRASDGKTINGREK